jgi:hypothetical protein
MGPVDRLVYRTRPWEVEARQFETTFRVDTKRCHERESVLC